MTAVSAARLLDAALPPESVRRATLQNGLRVLVRRDTRAPVVAIVTYVKAGYFDETDDVSGIAHVLEHMYFKGTSTRGVGEIARETKASGGYLNAATIYHQTSYYTVLPSSGFAAGLAIQADAYAHSLIDADELARELEVIIEEAKRKQDDPRAVATESLYALLHDQHRIRRWRIGREAGLRTLTRDQVRRFYQNFYRPSNTVLAIVGDVDADEALSRVEREYGAIPSGMVTRTPGPDEPAHTGDPFRYQEVSGDVRQAELVFGWRTPALLHPDTPALTVLAAVLAAGRASRLYRAVRERRLASSVLAYNYAPETLGVFVAHATAFPEQALAAARAIWHELARVRDGDVTPLEVERARRLVESQWLRRFEAMEGQATHLASWELFGDWTLGSVHVEQLLAVNAAQVTDVARRYLDPDQAGLMTYRPDQSAPFAPSAAIMRTQLDAERTAPVPPLARSPAPVTLPGTRAWMLEREEAGIHVFRTSAGIPVLVQRRPGPIAHLGWFVRGGVTDESAETGGVTTLMTRVSLKGTERRRAQRIAEDAEFLGGALGADAHAESFEWTMSVPVRRFDDAAELLADVVQRPAFADDAIAAERDVMLSNLASLRDDMYRWPLRLATEAAWGAHPYGRTTLGTAASLAACDAATLRRWHTTRALAAPGVIVCVADLDPHDAAGVVARHFGALRAVTRPEVSSPAWPETCVERVESRDKAQTALAMLYPAPARDDDARMAAALIAGVASGLGGRFFDELRDRQSLAYTVMAAPIVRSHAGAFLAYVATSPEKEARARDGLLAEFEKLRETPVTERELARAKTYALGTWAIRRESAGTVMGDIADAWLLGTSLRELETYETRVQAVTAGDMLALATRYFDSAHRVEGLVRGTGKAV